MTDAVAAPLLVALGYLSGSVPWGYVLPKVIKGVDVRTVGSGNIGATNAARAGGRLMGLVVFVLDVAKAMLQLGIGATDYDSNDVPDGCEELWTPEPLYVCCDANMECAAKMTTFCCAERGGITGYSFDTCTSMTCGLIE